MEIDIRHIELTDLSEVVKGWNHSVIFDKIDENHFKSIILDDANHQKQDTLVAIYDDKIVGFISCIAREGVSGADNRGRLQDKDYGYIKGMYVLEEFRRKGIGTKLLMEAENYLKSKEKNKIKVITYTGRYFFPGVDLRYEPALNFFESRGFKEDYIINDVDLEVKNYQIGDYQKDARKRMAAAGIRIEEYDPSMLDEMRKFVERLNMISWFPKGWENGFKAKGNKFVALKAKEIVGWASYHPSTGTAGFGPIGVLDDMRGNGIGSCLLLECVLKMKEAGADRVLASWANTPFYIANDWKICRQYKVFNKDMS
ncbi:GNAT family N-acetyltransferase [Candidatus Poribacteria bacterium]|nr:GNAT family N-acetyltransferase [Candidatus Poribacteria bacterium]